MEILLKNQMAEEYEDETVEHGYELGADEQEEEQVYPMNNCYNVWGTNVDEII